MKPRSLLWLLACGTLASCGADSPQPHFALYLVKALNEDIAKAELESRPLLTEQDIVSYDWQNHALTLTEAAVKKIRKDVHVGVSGKEFVIVADGRRVYVGAFWTWISSNSYGGPVIRVDSDEREVRIERAYPTAEFGLGDDPRGDRRILRALTAAGKIKNAGPSAPGKKPTPSGD